MTRGSHDLRVNIVTFVVSYSVSVLGVVCETSEVPEKAW